MSAALTDQPALRAVAARARALLGWPDDADVSVGAAEVNDFSVTFWMERAPADAVYVKLPRHRLFFERATPVFPPSPKDIADTRAEHESLTRLAAVLAGSAVRFVEPRGILEEAAALVTTRVTGPDAFRDFRAWDRAGDARLGRHLEDIGRMIAAVHAPDAEASEASLAPLLDKAARYVDRLGAHGVRSAALRQLPRVLAGAVGERAGTQATWSLKGIDVRNLLWNGRRLVSLDPGAMKRAVREADLARFLMTLRVLYWGSPAFFRGRRPRPGTESAVLAAYGYDTTDRRLLDWYLLKELLKHWHMAHLTIDLKSWPRPMKAAARRVYVDRFYDAELARVIATLDA